MIDNAILIENLTSLLPDFDRAFVQPFQAIARKTVTAAQLRVLLTLLSSGQPLPMSTLANRLDVSRPQLTATVEKLVQIGFIERFYEPADRRIISVMITDKAETFLHETQEKLTNLLSQRFSSLSAQEQERFLECIRLIKEFMEKTQ